jgi:glyoxylase-like metal-dependent hydrolase (beta-lactamase superfamily II)
VARVEAHKLRRKLNEIEEAVLVGGSITIDEAGVRAALDPLVNAGAGDERTRERVELLAQVAAGRRPKSAYQETWDTCGVKRYTTAGGRVIYLMPVETFPDHVNNVYLVKERGSKFLFDAGSLIAQSRDDFARAARVLAAVHGEVAPLENIDDVIVSHAHSDHFAGVGLWKKQGARIHVHELDARVISNFEERIVVASRSVRQFFQAAGLGEDERLELERMYVFSKNTFRSVPVDRVLTDGAHVCGALAHHVPGHCPGQICLQVDNVLLTADHVLPRITPHQAPESITQSTGLDHYFEALEKIRRVSGIDLGLPGHEAPIPRLHQRIVEIEAFHRERFTKVRAICEGGGSKTIKQIADAMFGAQTGYGRILAYQETGAHVEYLARRGLLEIDNVQDFETQLNPVVYYRAARA